jgi:hypothetical protein
MLGNGSPIQVPNLAALANPDPANFVQQSVLAGAGITVGGSGEVSTESGWIRLNEIHLLVLAIPPMIHVLTLVGRDAVTGGKVALPWHSVHGLRTE